MSKTQVDTGYKGWDGPFFPPEISRVMIPFGNEARFDNQKMDLLCRRAAEGFFYYDVILDGGELHTGDGYLLFFVAGFKLSPTDEVALAFPFCNDVVRQHGNRADRSVAVYTKGSPSKEQIKDVLFKVAHVLTHGHL